MTNANFTAIDFETAQGYRWSICQVGIVRVVNGHIVDELSKLIQPPDNYYWQSFTDIHGISAHDTANAPKFDKVWNSLRPFIEGQTVVAHNGKFDFTCLKQTLVLYELPQPDFKPACTYQIYKRGLATLCEEYKIPLDHHDALSDARACAELNFWLLKND